MVFRRGAVSFAWLFGLAACGGAETGGPVTNPPVNPDPNPTPDPTPTTTTGRVIDGPISGATVFIDENGNGLLDGGEISATTDADGTFEIEERSGVLYSTGGTDTVTGGSLAGVTLKAPAGADNITPLTTLLVELDGDADLLESIVGTDQFGVSGDYYPDASTVTQGALSGLKIMNMAQGVAALIEGSGGAADHAAAFSMAMQAIAAEFKNGTSVSLQSSETIANIIDRADSGGLISSDVTHAASTVLGQINAVDGVDAIAARRLVDESLMGELENVAANGATAEQLDDLQTAYRGEALDTQIDQAAADLSNRPDTLTFIGSSGNDSYHFNPGDGSVIIDENPTKSVDFIGGEDTLVFGPGIAFGDLTIRQPDGSFDLEITFEGTSDTVLLKNWMLDADIQVEHLQFEDGQIIDIAGRLHWNEPSQENDWVSGTAGADTLNALGRDDVVGGGAGNDTIDAGAGDDLIDGGPGADTIDGGDGEDTVSYAGSDYGVSVTLDANPGSGGDAEGDQLTNVENLIGSAFDDVLSGATNNQFDYNIFHGGDGDDVLWGWDGVDRLYGDGGSDELHGGESSDTLYGGDGGDFLYGDNNQDELWGQGGDDELTGGDSSDVLHGGAGNDILQGNQGEDDLYGEDGNDDLKGGSQNDTLLGGTGNDQLTGDDGDDILEGGVGDDILYGNTGADTYRFGANDGHDQLYEADGDGPGDIVQFTGDLQPDDLWFARDGENLVVSVIGGDTQVELVGWYGSYNAAIETFEAGGSVLYREELDTLVNAMSGATMPADPNADLPAGVAAAVDAYWHVGGNTAPKIDDVSFTTTEDHSVAGLVSASDLDGDAPSYEVGTGPTHGQLNLDGPTGTFRYTPDHNFHGTDSFTVQVTDEDGQTDAATVSITVSSVNDAPVASYLPLTIDEDTPMNVTPLPFTDVDGDLLSYSVDAAYNEIGGYYSVNSGIVYVYGDGTFQFIPDEDRHGLEIFDVTATDPSGASATASIVVTVTSLNDPPVAHALDFVTDEDVPAIGYLSSYDLDGDDLIHTVVTDPLHGTVVLSETRGIYNYTPNENFHGSDSFQVEVSDGIADPVVLTVPVTVNSVNDLPTSETMFLTLDEDTPGHGTATASDVDGDTVTFRILNTPSHGDVVLDPNTGDLTYTPDANYNGSDVFTFVVDDGYDHVETVVESVYVTIDPVNDAPIVAASSPSIQEDSYTEITGSLIKNDPDGDDTTLTSIDGQSFGVGSQYQGIYGHLTFTTSSAFTYTLNNADPDTDRLRTGQTVTEVFRAGVTDEHGATGWTDITINIHGNGQTYEGTAGGDVIEGSENADFLSGLAGNDLLKGLAGDDALHGDADDDRLEGGDGNDVLDGGSGDDELLGGTGNDVLDGGSGDDELLGGTGIDMLEGGAGADSFDGGDGEDTVTYINSEEAIVLALDGSTLSTGDAAGDVFIDVERFQATSFDDLLLGSTDTDILYGGGGNDIIIGNDRGDDGSYEFLIGDAGDDIIYAYKPNGTPGASTPSKDGGTGSFSLSGGDGNDVIYAATSFDSFNHMNGGSGDDRFYGGGGSDFIEGGPGADYIDAGVGGRQNQVLYLGSDSAVTVNLTTGTGSGGDAEGDQFVNVTDAVGSDYDDTLIGDGSRNALEGREGDDRLEGLGGNDSLIGGDGDDSLFGGDGSDSLLGQRGADLLDGGAGDDTAEYWASLDAVVVDLATGATSGGDAEGDTLVSIENVRGSRHDDTLTGDSGNNTLWGYQGSDRLFGGDGDDTLVVKSNSELDTGSDYLDGGDGTDSVYYSDSPNGVTVDLLHGVGTGGDAEGDQYVSVEDVYGSHYDDVLIGNEDVNRLDGGLLGNDILIGVGVRPGVGTGDALYGGAGDDLLINGYARGGSGADIMVATDGHVVIFNGTAEGDGQDASVDTFVLDTGYNVDDLLHGTEQSFQVFLDDYVVGTDKTDLSDLRDSGGNILDLQDILDHATSNGVGTEIDLSSFLSVEGDSISGTLTLTGLSDFNDLNASDFVFEDGVDWASLLPSGVEVV